MRTAIDVRVSTQRQAQAQTIDQQLERLQAYSRSQGWEVPPGHVFRDDGYSGATLQRPGLDALRDHVAQAAFDRVLLTSPDRLARNYVHQLLLIEECERGGCEVAFLERPMNQDPHDQLVLHIRGAVAEYERTLIAERMRRGRQAKIQAGALLPWVRPPYGYRTDPERPRAAAGVRLEPSEAALVAEVFASYLEERQSISGLAKHLTAIQAPTATGNTRWNGSTVRQLLRNPISTGKVSVGRTRARPPRARRSALPPIGRPGSSRTMTASDAWTLVAEIPAIVTPEQFDQGQAKLARNRQFARRNNTAHGYLLRALVSCGLCQTACRGRTSAGHSYSTCRGKAHPVQSCREATCPARYIPAAQLDDLVWADLCAVVMHPELIGDALRRAQGGAWLPQAVQARRENRQKAAASLGQQLERLTAAYLEGVIPLEEYQRRRQELDQRRQAHEEQMRRLEASIAHQADLAETMTSIAAFCQRVQRGLAQASFEQRRQLVELLIDRVVVTNEAVETRYVIPTSPRSEHTHFCHLRTDYLRREPVAFVVGGLPLCCHGRSIAHPSGLSLP